MSHTFLHFLLRHDTLFCFPGHDEYRAKQRLGRHDKVSKASKRGVSEKSNRTVNELSALPGFPSFHTGTSADRLVLAVTGASAPAAPKGFSLARGSIGACAVRHRNHVVGCLLADIIIETFGILSLSLQESCYCRLPNFLRSTVPQFLAAITPNAWLRSFAADVLNLFAVRCWN